MLNNTEITVVHEKYEIPKNEKTNTKFFEGNKNGE
jgi:hypothetical protein